MNSNLKRARQQMEALKSESLVDDSLTLYFQDLDEQQWNEVQRETYSLFVPTDAKLWFDKYVPQELTKDDDGAYITVVSEQHYFKDVDNGKDIICFIETGEPPYYPTYEQWMLWDSKEFIPSPERYVIALEEFKKKDEQYAEYAQAMYDNFADGVTVAICGVYYDKQGVALGFVLENGTIVGFDGATDVWIPE